LKVVVHPFELITYYTDWEWEFECPNELLSSEPCPNKLINVTYALGMI